MSRKQSAFLAKMHDIRREAQEASRKTFTQYLVDTAAITLNEEFGFGKDRIQTFLTEWGKQYDLFFDALRQTEETDYYRQKLDERLRPLCSAEKPFETFEERYLFLPEMKY